MKIWVARHGETAANIAKQFIGKVNPPLLPKGRRTAKKTAAFLKRKTCCPGIIYSSPLARARQTAQIIAKELGFKKIFFEKRLRELNFGCWERKTRQQAEKRFPGSVDKWLADPYKETPAKGESYFELEKRLLPFIKKIRKQKQKEIIIVAHANIIRVLPRLLLGFSKKQSLKTNKEFGTVHLFDLQKKKMKTFRAR